VTAPHSTTLIRLTRRIEPTTHPLHYKSTIALRGLAGLPVTLTQ
jgi:hypothetical protein